MDVCLIAEAFYLFEHVRYHRIDYLDQEWLKLIQIIDCALRGKAQTKSKWNRKFMEHGCYVVVEIVDFSAITEPTVVVVVLSTITEYVQKFVTILYKIIGELHHYVDTRHLWRNYCVCIVLSRGT